MKSGLIIYVAGKATLDWTEENETGIRDSEYQADLNSGDLL
jgi:hypothetical protein